jgi:hypothetical protein
MEAPAKMRKTESSTLLIYDMYFRDYKEKQPYYPMTLDQMRY